MPLLRTLGAKPAGTLRLPCILSALMIAVPFVLTVARASAQAPAPRPRPAFSTAVGNEEGAFAVAYSSDGTMVAASGLPPSIRIWNPQTGQLRRRLTGSTRLTRSLAFSPDSKVLAAGSDDGIARLWDPQTGALEQELPPLSGKVAVKFSRDSNELAVASAFEVKLWDRKQRQWRHTIRVGSLLVPPALAFSADGQMIAIGGGTEVGLRNLRSHKVERTIRVGDWSVFAIDYSPDGRVLAMGLDKGIPEGNALRLVSQVQLCDTRSGDIVLTLRYTGARVQAVSFSPDGRALATGGTGPAIHERRRVYIPSELTVWDWKTGKRLLTRLGEPGTLNALAYSADGKVLVTCDNAEVVLVDASTGAVKHILRGKAVKSEPQDKK
jgi:WD40 repeat protein